MSHCAGKLFVVGGFDGSHALRCVEVYNPARNEWRMLGSMTSSRSNAGVAMLGHAIYAVGGFDGNEFLNKMEVYNPETDEWNDCAKALSPLSDWREGGGGGVGEFHSASPFSKLTGLVT